jgi:hypothetical protein
MTEPFRTVSNLGQHYKTSLKASKMYYKTKSGITHVSALGQENAKPSALQGQIKFYWNKKGMISI